MKLKSDSRPAGEIPWSAEAEEALGKVPFFVRRLVRRKVAERVAACGGSRVSMDDFLEAEARFRSVAKDKSESELEKMMPADNEPGVEMVIVSACHSKLSGCPNVLTDTDEWRTAIENWIKEKGISERLREKVHGRKVLYHHKLKISISGCPNGCSRPQIADVGIVGYLKPFVDPAECTSCAGCEDVCPDKAIQVDGGPPIFDMSKCQGCVSCRDICPNDCIDISPQGVRILLGGKLGRHPHLAEFSSTAKTPAELISRLETVIDDFIENGEPEERFSDYRLRKLKGGGENGS